MTTRSATEPPADSAGLDGLPLRALAAFAYRCAVRVEPVRRLWHALPAAYSAGLAVPPSPGEGHYAVRAADRATLVAANALDPDADASFWVPATADALREAARVVTDGAVRRAADADLARLHALALGKPGEPGEPVRWDDPRLGPLWPAGPPAWYVEAEVQCREIEAKLRELAEPPVGPPSEALLVRNENWKRLDRRLTAGELDQYGGGYVISDGDTIFAHGWNLVEARDKAEPAARAAGVDVEHLVDYFVPAVE